MKNEELNKKAREYVRANGLGSDCLNDRMPSKPTIVGRGVLDAKQSIFKVTRCGSDR